MSKKQTKNRYLLSILQLPYDSLFFHVLFHYYILIKNPSNLIRARPVQNFKYYLLTISEISAKLYPMRILILFYNQFLIGTLSKFICTKS